MKNLFALVGLLTITFFGLGWYLDWYKLERQKSVDPDTQSYQIDINSKKVYKDVQKGIERGQEIFHNLTNGDDDSSKPKESKGFFGPLWSNSSAATTTNTQTSKEGWRPIGKENSVPPQDTAKRFNINPLPQPR